MAGCANCLITSTICKACRETVGGLKNAYVLAGEISGTTIDAGGSITSFSGSGTWFQFELERNTSNFTETINASLENGTVFYQQDLNLVFNKLQATTRAQLRLLSKCSSLRVAIETNDGTWFMLGLDYGMAVSAGTADTGLTFGDRNGYTITLTGFEKEPAREITTDLDTATTMTITEC